MRHPLDSIDKVNSKIDDVSIDNFIETSGLSTSSSSESSFLSKFSDDFEQEKWIDSNWLQKEMSSFDLSPQKSHIPRNRETDENQEVSRTTFTRTVQQRKMLRKLREGGGETDQADRRNSFRLSRESRQHRDLAGEKWTQSDNTEEESLLSLSSVSSQDSLAERLVRAERSIGSEGGGGGEEPGQADLGAPYNHLPLHFPHDQSDEKCSDRNCVNSPSSRGRESSAKPFLSANSDHRGSWGGGDSTENGDAGDNRDKADDNLLVTPNSAAERKRLKVIQSALKTTE